MDKLENLTKPKSMGGLGFWDMHNFNTTLLSWQGWRLLQNPGSLCTRIFNDRYFPHCHVLEDEPLNVVYHILEEAFSMECT